MTTRLAAEDSRVNPITTPQLSGRPRTLVRATHVGFSAGWLGLVVAMLTLGIAAATAPDPTFSIACYAMMDRIGGAVIPVFAVATMVTGITLSIATPWRLLHHRWVVVKLVLALVVIVSAIALTGDWLQQAVARAAATPAGNGSTAGWPAWLLVAASVFHLLVLWAATMVDKPWGKTRRGRRAADRRREALLRENALDAVSQHPVVGQRRLARRIDFGEIVEEPSHDRQPGLGDRRVKT
ncbi:MAG: hypothetical protein ACRDRO_00305 [Pseudonocardiaceae bacterium]